MAHPILRGSGNTPENERAIAALKTALPDREYGAVAAWLSTFYGYQQTWILDQDRFSILLKCRQIGASHSYAAAAVLWGLFAEDTSIVSIGERESGEVLKKAAKHCEALASFGSAWARPRAISALRISMASGGSVTALPATSGGRGQSGNVLLDEAAYFEHAADVVDGAAGSVLHGYRLRLMSTPNGIGNMFHKAWVDAKKNGYRKHQTTLYDAITDGLQVDMADCRKMAMGDERLFAQLFLGAFLDDQLQYIPSEAVDACSVEGITIGPGDFYGGLDIGRSADLTSLAIVRKREDGLRLLQFLKTCKRTDSVALDNMVDEAFARFHLKRLCVDESGLGIFPVELMQKRHGRIRVEGVTFTQQSKEALATGLYSAFTEEYVRIPKTDDALPGMAPGSAVALRDDICSIRRIITAAGNIRYDAPHTDDGHADRAWSLALALHACAGPAGQKFVASGR